MLNKLTDTIDAYKPQSNSHQNKKKLSQSVSKLDKIGTQALHKEGGPEKQSDLLPYQD